MLKVMGIKKSFGAKSVLREIDFAADAGTLTVIEGKNGAGKSTLFSVLCGIVAQDEGAIELDNLDLGPLPAIQRALHIAILRQDPGAGTVNAFTVLENFSLATLKNRRASLRYAQGPHLRQKVKDHLEDLDLANINVNQRLAHFSGGQRQMLAFAIATLNKPKLLLLDEPTAALDEEASIRMMELIKHFLKKWRIPAVMISHDHDLNNQYADKILRLEAGKLVAVV